MENRKKKREEKRNDKTDQMKEVNEKRKKKRKISQAILSNFIRNKKPLRVNVQKSNIQYN